MLRWKKPRWMKKLLGEPITVGPQEFIRLYKQGRIESSKIVLPRLGSRQFAKFKVKLK